MSIDLLVAGFTLQEVPCDLKHRATGHDLSGQLHRAAQYRDVALAVNARRLRRVAVPFDELREAAADQRPGEPYRARRGSAVTGE